MQRLAAQKIGVLVQRFDGARTEGAVGGHGILRRQAVPGKPRHDLPHAVHTAEFLRDGFRLFFGDAAQLAQALGRFGNDGQRFLAEFFNDFFRGGGSDVRQHPAGKIAQQRLRVLRQAGFAGFCLELLAVAGMVDQMPVDRHAHTVVDAADIARHNDIGAAGVHLKHGVAGFGIFVDDALHHALQLLQFCRLVFHRCPLLSSKIMRILTHLHSISCIIPQIAGFGKVGGIQKGRRPVRCSVLFRKLLSDFYSATAALRASARSVFSHLTPRSSRPICP